MAPFLAKAPERYTRLGIWTISITMLYREMIWIARCGTVRDGTLAYSKFIYSTRCDDLFFLLWLGPGHNRNEFTCLGVLLDI
jgi:hypothetical protein